MHKVNTMKTYKLINADLFLNGVIIPEGSEVKLSDTESEQLSKFLSPLDSVTENKSKPDISNKKRSKQ